MLVGLEDEGQGVEGGARGFAAAVPGDDHAAERGEAGRVVRGDEHRPAGIVEQRVDVGRSAPSGSGLGGDDEVAAAGAGDAGMGAVAGKALQAAPFGGDAGVGGALPEDRFELLRRAPGSPRSMPG